MSEKRIRILAKLALLATTMIWGSSFFMMKNTLDAIPAFYILAFRFTVGAVLLSLLFFRKWRLLDWTSLKYGALMGTFLWLAYVFQTHGLMNTTPSNNAFLTAVYCVIVPFLSWGVTRRRPDRYHFAGAVLCIVGIGLISLSDQFSMAIGDALSVTSGLFYACHIIAVSRFAARRDIIFLTIIQFGVAALLSWTCGLFFETFPTQLGTDTVAGLIYLCVFATTVALLFQNIGQKYTEPVTASIILTLESVFGATFSMIFYGDRLTPRLLCGFILIFFAVICAETKLAFLKRKKPAIASKNSGLRP